MKIHPMMIRIQAAVLRRMRAAAAVAHRRLKAAHKAQLQNNQPHLKKKNRHRSHRARAQNKIRIKIAIVTVRVTVHPALRRKRKKMQDPRLRLSPNARLRSKKMLMTRMKKKRDQAQAQAHRLIKRQNPRKRLLSSVSPLSHARRKQVLNRHPVVRAPAHHHLVTLAQEVVQAHQAQAHRVQRRK